MKAPELLAQAQRLGKATKRRPRQVDLKRAVSAAYYAQFHWLAKLCADTVAGTGASRSERAWQQTYRALAHGRAKDACKKARNVNPPFPPGIVEFAELFVSMQENRHAADYDPLSAFRRAEVETMIKSVDRAINGMKVPPRADLRAFVAWVLLETRPR